MRDRNEARAAEGGEGYATQRIKDEPEATQYILIYFVTSKPTKGTKSLFKVRISLDGQSQRNLSYSPQDTKVKWFVMYLEANQS